MLLGGASSAWRWAQSSHVASSLSCRFGWHRAAARARGTRVTGEGSRNVTPPVVK